MGDIYTGDIVFTRSFDAHFENERASGHLNFKLPKDKKRHYYTLMFLGTTDDMDGFDPRVVLNAIGWFGFPENEEGPDGKPFDSAGFIAKIVRTLLTYRIKGWYSRIKSEYLTKEGPLREAAKKVPKDLNFDLLTLEDIAAIYDELLSAIKQEDR